MHRMAYSTQFLIPALLNPMINKMANKASAILLLICSHEFRVKVSYDWSTALCSCLWLWWPRFYKLKLRHIKGWAQEESTCPFFLCLCLCLCRPSFHLLTYVLVLMLVLWWKPVMVFYDKFVKQKSHSKCCTIHFYFFGCLMWRPGPCEQSLLQSSLSDSVCSQSRPPGKFRITSPYFHALSEGQDDYITIPFFFILKTSKSASTYCLWSTLSVGLEN